MLLTSSPIPTGKVKQNSQPPLRSAPQVHIPPLYPPSAEMETSRPSSLSARPLDFTYVIWFALHLAIMFTVDLVPLYPKALQPSSLLALRQWYITTYHDRFFVDPPAWFNLFAWMELVYHVPLSLWVIGGLWRGEHHVYVWRVIRGFLVELVFTGPSWNIFWGELSM